MPNQILHIIIFAALLLMLFQDIKYRRIHILLPVILCVCGISLYLEQSRFWSNLALGAGFLVLILSFTYLYFSFKFKEFRNPFKNLIGLGDIVFFFAILPFFILNNYIIFFITGLLFSLFCYGIFKIFSKKTSTVPLAGLLSLYLMGWYILGAFATDFNFYTPLL